MERISRVAVLVSTIVAAASYAAVTGIIVPGVQWWALGALVVGVALCRISFALGAATAFVLTYTAPALFMTLFGREEYHLLSIWMGGLTGVAVAAADWSRWHLPRRWRWPLITWALLVAVTWPIIAGRETDFSLVALMSPDTPNGVLGGPPAPSAAWIISVALAHLLAFIWMDLLWARFGHGRIGRLERVVLVPVLASALIGAVVGLYQDYVDVRWASGAFWPATGRAAGLMLDANSFGTASALWCAASVALMWRLKRSTIAAVVLFGVLATAMWASGSRTAFIAAGIGSIGLAGALSNRGWKGRLAPVAALTTVAIIVVAVAWNARDASDRGSPIKRWVDLLTSEDTQTPAGLVTKLWVRDGYGPAATQAISEHPVSGVGIGAFNQLSSDYYFLLTGQRIPPDNAQNWWRHQAAELGLFGALPAFATSVLLVGLLKRRSDIHPAAATVLKSIVIAVGVISVLGLSTQHPALLLTFAVLAVWLALLVHVDAEAAPPRPIPAWVWASSMLVVAAVAGTQAWTARHELRVPYRAMRAGFPYAYGFSDEEQGPTGPIRWTAAEAVAIVPVEHRYFELTMWTLHPDVTDRPVQVRIRQDGRQVADFTSVDRTPHTTVLEMQPGQPRALIEIDVSRTFDDGRGLRLAAQWRRE